MRRESIWLFMFVGVLLVWVSAEGETPREVETASMPPQSRDGSEMVLVPGGKFFMGCNAKVDTECDDDEKPGRVLSVETFKIDKTEVTVAQYGKCVAAGACSADGLTIPFWAGVDNQEHPEWAWACNWGNVGRENHPINCVDWQHAWAYCEWAGKRLPTEAQWEKAARGTDGRKYPWGNQEYKTAGLVANIADETTGRSQPPWSVAEGYNDNYHGTAPVGSFPAGASPYGALDMAGNLWEWTADWYDAEHQYRSARGGSWADQPRYTRVSNRDKDAPNARYGVVGFRCVQQEILQGVKLRGPEFRASRGETLVRSVLLISPR